MTPQEAIEIIENERPGCGEKVRYSEGELCEAFDMANEALENKIPRKIEMKVDMFDTSYNLYCPACGTYFGTKGKRGIWLGMKPAYCRYCGQRLDWSDVDDNIPK